ncbi:Uma2 family endonuclease [Sporomusa acidovorans]|uniref:Putative restriction endonuclease domain-containing protein n=1 Tax=Sporomusa acidovorans (strain ATCC 49682 / DSM 3132 / Mol) TaxID=1123286 RepID=A0ABZ3J7U0_SPOA4|nr:Uma2 family endonuclease [Sporomusa acidovorans]OZC19381.1 hypothetical protein SPACI_29710 [Sporomusa acidovorans DSM 3132]SDD78612.1 Endonuclease, Uma2 family (restriction endonuclease fold) [Sporomusa acidovorans]
MSSNAIKNVKIYTYKDYLTWPEGERWELIDGTAYAMSPAPNRLHQEILRELMFHFTGYLKNKTCKVYPAPFDVRLPRKGETDDAASTVVQPDITIVCDSNKLDKRGCKGSPDLIIEILSPSTASFDVIKKRGLYEQNGVLEYWIVDPVHQIITRFYINAELSKYREAEYFSKDDTIHPIIFPDLQIDLKDIFQEILNTNGDGLE